VQAPEHFINLELADALVHCRAAASTLRPQLLLRASGPRR